ncbi:helix-turn-helix domain-containing protein [Streptomycetaceae bacterium NBC_01309]
MPERIPGGSSDRRPAAVPDGTMFGTQLRALREERGMDQSKLGELAKFHRSYVSKVECGRQRPSEEFVAGVLMVFGDDPRLLRLTSDAAADPVTSTGTRLSPEDGPIPTGLPPWDRHFLGREHQLAALCGRIRARDGRVCAVVGMPGVGKTALAARVAYTLRRDFPGGCLFVDLRGWTRGVLPLRPGEVLGRLLRRLRVPDEEIPASAAERSAEFRHRTASRGILLVLDNVRDAGQVELLLPDAASSAVLLTSRDRLKALDAYRLALRPLPPEPAARLVRAVAELGDVPEAEDGVRRIVGRCDGLPLALRLAASRCRADGPRSPGELAESMTADADRWAELSDGTSAVRGEFELSVGRLGGAELDVFTALALQPGTGADATLAATLTGLPLPAARRALESLYDVSLLDWDAVREYRCHDLVRAMACERFAALSAPWRHELTRRRLDHALRTARAADAWISPYRYFPPLPALPADLPPPVARSFASRADALEWATRELRTLVDLCRVAYSEGFDQHCWQLAHALRGVFFLGGHQDLWVQAHGWALSSAERCGSPEGEALTLANLGLALQYERHWEVAEGYLDRAVTLFRHLGNEHGEFTARSHRAWVLHQQGHHEDALREELAALEFHTRNAAHRNVAILQRDVALIELSLDRVDDAVRHLDQALAAFVELGLALDVTMALNCLGEAAVRRERADDARRLHRQALAAARSCGSRREYARALFRLGQLAARDHRQPGVAALHLRHALEEFTAVRAVGEVQEVRAELQRLTP